MGFARRAVHRSARRAVRRTVTKPVRKAVRTATPRPVRQAMHPVYTARNAVTPRPVKQVGYAVHATRHPFFAAWDAIFGGVFRRHRRSAPVPARHPAPARSAQRQAAPAQRPASAAPSRLARQAPPPPAPVPIVTEMIRWREGPGGLAFQACLTDVHDLSSLWRQVTADLTNNDLRLQVHVLCARFQADVSAALAAPAMPDPQARSALAMALSASQRAIEDLRVGLDLRNAEVLRQAGAQWDVAGAHLREMTARIRAITPPAPRAASPRREPWPANRAFRTPAQVIHTRPQLPMPPPTSAGDWELQTRRNTGLGDGNEHSK